MRVMMALTYYRPHYSGLTIYTERLARALVTRGHQVTVITSRFNRNLPAHEIRDGVEVIRPWVLMRISKGVIMPAMGLEAFKVLRRADIVNLHVPQLDAAPISILTRITGKPVVLTYHCDLYLPKGFIHSIANQVSHLANHISARSADRIVTNTLDYAENSSFLKNYLGKTCIIPTPVYVSPASEIEIANFREKYHLGSEDIVIGMVARLATEKGVEYLIEAMPAILERYPRAKVLFVGQYKDVLGEEQYAASLAPLIENLGEHWNFLGTLSDVELAAFYSLCNVKVLPSINATESFGIVQVEAMTRGTPVVATDMPGIRQAVLTTGMGRIVPPRNAGAIAEAVIEILDHPDRYQGDPFAIAERYSPATVAKEYEALFKQLLG